MITGHYYDHFQTVSLSSTSLIGYQRYRPKTSMKTAKSFKIECQFYSMENQFDEAVEQLTLRFLLEKLTGEIALN